MQKWHIHSAIGRGRPLLYKPRNLIVFSGHYLHTTSPRAQEVTGGRTTDPPKPPSSRAKRLHEATSSLENLYLRSAAHNNFTYQPTVLAPRHIGAPLSRDVIDGNERVQSSNDERFTMGRQQRARTPAGREVNQPAIDARSLAARPAGAQGPLRIRRVSLDFNEEKASFKELNFQSRSPQDGNGVQNHPLNDTNRFQQHSLSREKDFQRHPSREESTRYTGTLEAGAVGQSYQNRFSKDQNGLQRRTSRGEGRPPQAGRSRPSRPRASLNSGNPEGRRRQRNTERDAGGNNRRGPKGPKEETWTEEEQQYLKEEAKRKEPKPLEYEPVEFSRDTFTGMGPATAADEWGMSEMLGERLVLARKYLNREFIQWDSKEQKADVMAVVEKLKAVRREEKSNGNGDLQAQAVMQKMVAGDYAKFKRPGEKDVLGHVEMYVHRNDSFYPKDEESLLDKVKSIIPTQQISKVGRKARDEVNA